jgi:hypothetical protein
MRFAVAVVAPPGRVLSESFREVAQTLDHALCALGHDSVQTNRFDMDDRRTIVLQPMLIPWCNLDPPANPILYNLEAVDARSPWMTSELLDLFKRYPTWDYSHANIERLAVWQIPRPTHVPIGYVPELTRITPGYEDIDVLFYGMVNERRLNILTELHNRGLQVRALSGVFGPSRDAWISRSKVVVNIHQFDGQPFEIVRVSYLLANKRVVVSEHGADPADERGLESGMVFANHRDIADRCVELCADKRARQELGERGYQAFAARSEAAILQRVLSANSD